MVFPISKVKRMNERKSIISKIFYMLDRKEKLQTVLIVFLSIISAAAELIGVSIILPIINLTMGQANIEDNLYCRILIALFGVNDNRSIIIMLTVSTILIYIIKNIYRLLFLHFRLY